MSRAEVVEVLLGLGLVTAGVAMVHVPTALIIDGVAIVAFGVLPTLRRG